MTQVKTTVKNILLTDNIQKRFQEILGKKAQGYISSVIQISQSKNMVGVDPTSIVAAAVTAATLDLPINPSLGFAWIVPYNGKEKNEAGKWVEVKKAQFQIGWKGFVQLAQRSGQYKRINVVKVYESQFKSFNALTEDLDCDFSMEPDGKVVGYVAYFRLVNGFEKLSFWSTAKVDAHAKKYSKAYGKDFSAWNKKDPDKYEAMGLKTVLKNTLSKYGVLSIEMQTAQIADQAVVTEEGEFQYVDNEPATISERAQENERARILKHIEESESIESLKQVAHLVSEYDLGAEYETKSLTFKKD